MLSSYLFLSSRLATTTPGITIDELTVPDLEDGFLTALASLADVGLTPAQAKTILLTRLRLGIQTFVARCDGRVVGTASLLVEPKFIHQGGLVGHVEDVAVHPDYQGCGIGTLLVKHVTHHAHQLGCYKVVLDCREDLVPFYERMGYRHHNVGMRHDLEAA